MTKRRRNLPYAALIIAHPSRRRGECASRGSTGGGCADDVEGRLAQEDDVVEKLASEGTDNAFGKGLLSGRAWRNRNPCAHAFHSSPNFAPVDVRNLVVDAF